MGLSYKLIAAKGIDIADTNESFYTVAASQRVVGQIIVANTSSTNNRKFRLAIVKNGDSLGPEHYLAYDITLTPGETVAFSGLTLGEGDAITVRSDAVSSAFAGTGIIFHLYGELDDNVI